MPSTFVIFVGVCSNGEKGLPYRGRALYSRAHLRGKSCRPAFIPGNMFYRVRRGIRRRRCRFGIRWKPRRRKDVSLGVALCGLDFFSNGERKFLYFLGSVPNGLASAWWEESGGAVGEGRGEGSLRGGVGRDAWGRVLPIFTNSKYGL